MQIARHLIFFLNYETNPSIPQFSISRKLEIWHKHFHCILFLLALRASTRGER